MNSRQDRKKIIEDLIARDGNRCYFCGAENVSLEVHHFLPLSAGGTGSIENSILICPNCHSLIINKKITEYDFVTYLIQLLTLNDDFRNIRSEVSIAGGIPYYADIFAEEKRNGEWKEVVFECKVSSSFTESRLQSVIEQLRIYRSFLDPKQIRFIFVFPGELDPKYYHRFEQLDIEIWDLPYISKRFRHEILQVSNPALQTLFLTQKPTTMSPELKLIQDLQACRPGKKEWSKYQKLVGQILERLFCPPLTTPISELSDYTKTNRRDFILPNYSENGFWEFIRSQYSGDYIVVDAKNYISKIKKQHILQISNYLKKHGAGLFAIIMCRNGGDSSCIQTIREVWAIYRKLIIVLTDDDIEKMLFEKSSGRDPEIIIRQKIEDFRLTL